MKIMNAIKGAAAGWQMRDTKMMLQSVLKTKNMSMDMADNALDGQKGGRASARAIALEGYIQNAIVHRCAKLISDACSSVHVQAEQGGQVIPNHAAIALLDNPQGVDGQLDAVELREAVYSSLAIHGEVFIDRITPQWTPTSPLVIRRPDRMQQRTGKNGNMLGWTHSSGSGANKKSQDIKKARVCHIRTFNPLDDYRGLSPVQPAAYGVDVHNKINQSTIGLMNNQGRPSGALVYKSQANQDMMPEGSFERVKREIGELFSNAANKGAPMLLEGGLDWKAMGYSPADALHLDMAWKAAREIALAMGVPPMLLGIPGDNTYANYQEASRAFYRQTVMPLVKKVLSRLTSWMIWQDGGDRATRLVADWHSVPVIAQDRREQMVALDAVSFMTIEEKREAVGLPREPVYGKVIIPGSNFTLEQIISEATENE